MSGPILSTIGNLMDKLKETWADLDWAFGRRKLAQLDAPEPFIVWAPSEAGDRFEPVDPAFAERDSPNAPQALQTIVTRLEAHCRGKTFDLTEALRHDLASIVRQQLPGSAVLVGGGWLDAGNQMTSRSEVYVLLVDLRAPITDQLQGQSAQETAEVETVAVESEIQIPGGTVEPDVVLP